MNIRIIFFSTTPEALEQGKKIWDAEMAPLLKQQKGFLKAYRADATDEPGGGVMVQIWESKRDEDAWRSSEEYKKIIAKVEAHIPQLSIERDFEVDKEV